MEYIKSHKISIIIILIVVLLVASLSIFFMVLAKNNEVITDAITFQEKYGDCENKVTNLVTTNSVREGYRTELSKYTDKVKQDYNMTIDDKDAFITLARKIDADSLSSKMHVVSFYGKVKKQFDTDVANNYFTPEVKARLDSLFTEYATAFKEGKYQEAYNILDEISKQLSVRVTEEGIQTEASAQTAQAATPAPQENPNPEATPQTTSNATGRGYHPEAKAGDTVVDPNNGNVGVVANNGIEVYTLPNETTYSYITKDEFVAMLVRSGTREALARIWADQMANAQGLITIGVDDDGTYE